MKNLSGKKLKGVLNFANSWNDETDSYDVPSGSFAVACLVCPQLRFSPLSDQPANTAILLGMALGQVLTDMSHRRYLGIRDSND